MSNGILPSYLSMAKPNPMENRAPWYKNTAPSYAGIFLSVPFMAGTVGALQYGSVWAAVVGLFLGALFCFILYYVPGMLGLRTGMPLYVVGSSTFGSHGGILMPGLLMGVLQIGWHAVFTFSAASFFMTAIGSNAGPNTAIFWLVCVVWGIALAFVGAVGIGILSKLSSWLPIFPLLIIVIAGFANMSGLSKFSTSVSVSLPGAAAALIPVLGLGAFAAIQAAAGFFATAGAAGADFAMNSRNKKDVVLGGLFGITIAALVAGFFSILTIAGAMGKSPEIAVKAGMGTAKLDVFAAFISSIGAVGALSKIMYWVFVIACICPTGFCAFLAANSFSTMFPKLPRTGMTLAAGAIGVILAATGTAQNLVGFFLIIGASFGPIIGAMTADYIRSGGWSGPRKGINKAGYIAWAAGFLVGILGIIPGIGFSYGLETLMSFVVGFAVYLILAELGLEPETVKLNTAK
ncbi:MAG: cytosine permease [Sedimentisphaerales bacterium]